MPRPCKKRMICLNLQSLYFSPCESFDVAPDDVVMEVDEIEAVRLADFKGKYQEDAARRMGISRATFSNTIKRAHHKISTALLKGKAIRINCPKMAKKMDLAQGEKMREIRY